MTGPTTDTGAIAQTALNVYNGIYNATFVVAGTHGQVARLWSSDVPVNGQGTTIFSNSLHADTAAGQTTLTIKAATDAKGAAPDVHLALLYACETIQGGDTKLKTAFLRSQTADSAIGAFPLLLYYETVPGTPASTHTSKLLDRLNAGDTFEVAISKANFTAMPVTVGGADNPMILQGDPKLTSKYVYLTSAQLLLVTDPKVWYIVMKGGTIQ